MRNNPIAAILFSCFLLTNLVMSAQALPGSIPKDAGTDSTTDLHYDLTAASNNTGRNNDLPDENPREQWHIAEGNLFKVAVSTFGTVKCWGLNDRGQCNVPLGLARVAAVEAGGAFTLARLANGTVIAWGSNDHGQTNVPANLPLATAIAVGSDYSLVILEDGTVAAWGNNDLGQTNVPANLSGVTAIAGGMHHSLALTRDGTPVAWGDNRFGQTDIPSGLSNVKQIAAGGYHNLALRDNGTVACWGMNTYGQCNVPQNLTNVTLVTAGMDHSLALKDDGTFVSWGFPPSEPQTTVRGEHSSIASTNIADSYYGVYDIFAICDNGDRLVWSWNNYDLESILSDNSGYNPVVPNLTPPALLRLQKVSNKDLLDHPYRSIIFEKISSSPGMQFNHLCRTLGINRGTLHYHLNTLLSAQEILAKEYSGKTVYFANNERFGDPERRLLTHLKNPARRELLQKLHAHGRLRRGDLIDLTQQSTASAAWHLKSLSGEGIVRIEKSGREAHYSLHPEIASVFSGLIAAAVE
ncbi:MAG: hypothetical protein Q8R70_10365 [Methanoregula sp.]|nr:hypothetical protein [Methanoregula sp.]